METKGLIKWATCGDAGTKFYHANATIRHRQNAIAFIQDNDGFDISNHDDKAKIIFEAFREKTRNLRKYNNEV